VSAAGGPAAMAATHERFLVELGLAGGEVEQIGTDWRVRFERQLVRPAEAAWRLLVGDGQPRVGDPVPAGTIPADITPGRVTDVEPNRLLECDWLRHGRPAGRVRWRFGAGTGQGARLVFTQTGPADAVAERDAALAAWGEHIERFAAELARTVPATSAGSVPAAPAGSPA
jgi:activator of Hsp90 ATPase-like protein